MWRRLLRALWNTRLAALFMAGPALGLAIIGITFGLPAGPRWLALATGILAAGLLGVLVRAEYARLSRFGRL